MNNDTDATAVALAMATAAANGNPQDVLDLWELTGPSRRGHVLLALAVQPASMIQALGHDPTTILRTTLNQMETGQ